MKKALFIFVFIGLSIIFGLFFYGLDVKICKASFFSIEKKEHIVVKSLDIGNGLFFVNDSISIDSWAYGLEISDVLTLGSVITKKANSREIIIKSKRGDTIVTKLLPIWHTQDSLMKRKYEICCDARLNIIRKIGLINLKCD